jgi:hypothetical protein
MGSGVKLHSNNLELPMSALGQKRTLRGVRPMSALPPKADIVECDRHSQNKGDVKIKTPSGTLVIRG